MSTTDPFDLTDFPWPGHDDDLFDTSGPWTGHAVLDTFCTLTEKAVELGT